MRTLILSKRGRQNEKKSKALTKFFHINLNQTQVPFLSKFNFHYLDQSQDFSGEISTWNTGNTDDASLYTLIDNLRQFSSEPLHHWITQGKFKHYPYFNSTNFIPPTNVPQEAVWGAFRLTGRVRLIGFSVPGNLHGTEFTDSNGKKHENIFYDKETFYITFLDDQHKFWPSKKKNT